MKLRVCSEIGRLRRVLIHRPGQEIDWMVPSMMERLLFDDILYGEEARQEHDLFRAVLEASGVETLDPQQLLSEVLVDDGARMQAVGELVGLHGGALAEALASLTPAELASALVTGKRALHEGSGSKLHDFYDLAPIPNYFFQRDPQVVVGDRVIVSSMATEARQREPMLSRWCFEKHPDLAGWSEMVQLSAGSGSRQPWIEGGDVLVPRKDILLVGLSERTNRRGIDTLARHLQNSDSEFRHMLVVEIPSQRSYMHLDTVFTFIDHGLCLAYLPVIAAGGAEAGDVYRIDLEAKELSYTICDSLPAAMAALDYEIELVPCGGSASLIDQQREQWTDGANAFALAPGVIATYRRNRRTAEELSERGWRVIRGEDIAAGEAEALDQGPTLITLPDNELSRARGGPRCMTMPILRDDV